MSAGGEAPQYREEVGVGTGSRLPAVSVELHHHGSVGHQDPERLAVLVEYRDQLPGDDGRLPGGYKVQQQASDMPLPSQYFRPPNAIEGKEN